MTWYREINDGAGFEPVARADVLGGLDVMANRWGVQTEVAPGVEVSTVFLAIDHSFDGSGPILYETMVFGGPPEAADFQARYRTRAEAEVGHANVCEAVRAVLRREVTP